MKVYKNFLNQEEISAIISYKDKQPIASESFLSDGRPKAKHRNLNLEIDDTIKNILFPKLENIFPNFKVDTGSFLQSYTPHNLHIDTNKYHSEKLKVTDIKNSEYNMSVMLPLTNDFGSHTVYFDYYCEKFNKQELLNDLHDISEQDKNFDQSHVLEIDKAIIKKLKVDYIYEWAIGDCVVWPRNQMHMATGYHQPNTHKQAIVIFLQ